MRANGKYILRSLLVLILITAGFCAWWLTWHDNYHEVIPGQLYRSGQVSVPQLLAYARRDKLATVLSLRSDVHEPWHEREVRACHENGIVHVDFPMSGNHAPTVQELDELEDLMQKAKRPLLVHCEYGADRTGLAVAIYLAAIDHQPEGSAQKALSLKFGHLPLMRVFDEAFQRYCNR